MNEKEKEALRLVTLIKSLDDDEAVKVVLEAIENCKVNHFQMSKREAVAAQTMQTLIASGKFGGVFSKKDIEQIARVSAALSHDLFEYVVY